MSQFTPSLEALIQDRTKRLTDYQNAAYAQRFEAYVREIAAVEGSSTGGDCLAREVATSLYKLMTHKVEYENVGHRVLSRTRRLRRSIFAMFECTEKRSVERAAIGEYEATMRDVVEHLTSERLPTGLHIARLPQTVLGFGHVKTRNAAAAKVRRDALLREFDTGLVAESKSRRRQFERAVSHDIPWVHPG